MVKNGHFGPLKQQNTDILGIGHVTVPDMVSYVHVSFLGVFLRLWEELGHFWPFLAKNAAILGPKMVKNGHFDPKETKH